MQNTAPIDPPHLGPFADGVYWVLWEELIYNVGATDHSIVVPAGFVTDFASVPQIFWSLGLGPTGRYTKAAIVHDYLYWTQSCTREQSDQLFLLAMKESGVNDAQLFAVFGGVRVGAGPAWDVNTEERRQQLPKHVPAEQVQLIKATTEWPQLRQQLRELKVLDPAVPPSAPYCSAAEKHDPLDVPAQYIMRP